ncbi:MAG: FAD binding domain-containing protein [Spirochaetales bacterium]|nr:FAD binding domain-containing protein [Spirochaetales bacterium]
MAKSNTSVLITNTLSDVLYQVKSVNDLQILGGCTQVKELAEKTITIRSIPELCSLEKKERYIDYGPGITLAKMAQTGRSNMSHVLYDAINTVGNFATRNIATLGGNICALGQKHTLWAPLLALDARLEFKNSGETQYIFMSNFKEIPKGFVLTKIRVPYDEYEVEIFKRLGPSNSITPLSAGFVFLAQTQKDIVANVKIAFAGTVVFRSRELENKIIGAKLPLSQHYISLILEEAEKLSQDEFSGKDILPIFKDQFLNLLRYSLEQLT